MCQICVDWAKGKMTSKEAYRALGELMLGNSERSKENDHYFEVSEKIMAKEVPFTPDDQNGTD
jgi:hypothetical protein